MATLAPSESGTSGIASLGASPFPRLVNALALLSLSPVQLGIGVKNGAKIGGRVAQLVFDSEDNLVLLSLDNKNGFKTLPRGLICSGVAEFALELLHWFQYAYGGPSPLLGYVYG
jgi:hypothetical protein